MNKLPLFGRVNLERHYECRYCKEKTIKQSRALIVFRKIITIPFTTKICHTRMLEEGYYDK